MRKLKFFLNYEKEEKWLNEMANKGYRFVDVGFGYKFKASEPQDTKIRIDYRTFKNKRDFIDYCMMFKDSGWMHIAGDKCSGAQYFKKMNEDSDEEIFSDQISKAGRYKRASKISLSIGSSYLPISIIFYSTGTFKISTLLNPKLLYHTPGLWDANNTHFWFSFLFETPFALMRLLSMIFFPIAAIACIYCALKTRLLYKKCLEEKI